LLTKNDTHFYTESLINRMKKREEISKLRAEVGAIGGKKYRTRDSGVDNEGKGQFYVIRCWNKDEEFLKVGTTGAKINRRYSSNANMPYDYEVLYQAMSTKGNMATIEIEGKIESRLGEYSYTPAIRFPGGGECYSLAAMEIIDQALTEMGGEIKLYKSKAQAKHKQSTSIKGKESKGNKSKVKEKKDSGSLALAELPVEIYSDELRDVWSEYERHRTEKRSKLTPTARVKAIKNLVKLSRGDPGLAVRVVEQSIANGWTGLFELKGNNGTSKTRETAQEWLREKELEGH
jgi:hypothetical protein